MVDVVSVVKTLLGAAALMTCAWYGGIMADRRNRSVWTWRVVGVMTGLIGLVVLSFLPMLDDLEDEVSDE